MKRILFLNLFAFFALQLSVSAQATEFKINEIGIGSGYSTVIKKFGKPLSSKKGGIVPCSDGSTNLTLRYKGLEIWLSKDEDEKSFTVYAMWANSPKYSVLGISIGSPMKSIKARFGEPYHQTRKSGLLGLHYNNNKGISGAASFYFRDNKLKEVNLYLNYC
jgi:hypothetical protein